MNHNETPAETTEAVWPGQSAQIFRSEALAYYSQGQTRAGDLLRLTPTWTRWTYWLLVVVVTCGLIGAYVGTLDQYASGPALVQIQTNPGQRTPLIIASLPGYQRPLLRVGMPLRLTLTGYQAIYQTLTIEAIDDKLLAPTEVRERLGSKLANTAPSGGPIVLVRARAAEATFITEGRALPYIEGMQGQVEVRVRSERILFTLLPALKMLIRNS